MAFRSILSSVYRRINRSQCYQLRENHRRAVLPMNTYHRFRKEDHQGLQPQSFKYFLVLDFEATCDEQYFPEMEIIEFPCLKVDSRTFEIVDQFHSYVRPVKHPLLTQFCMSLTGICQDVVDDQLPFEEVLKQFFLWIESNDIELDGPKPNAIFVTCGDWDLLTMLPKQCGLSGLPVPTIMKSWVNIKKAFLQATGVYPHGIKDMLALLKLEHEGRLHSGIDDCRNILKIMRGVADRGYVFKMTRSSSDKM